MSRGTFDPDASSGIDLSLPPVARGSFRGARETEDPDDGAEGRPFGGSGREALAA